MSTDTTTIGTDATTPARSAVEQAMQKARIPGPRPTQGVPFGRLVMVEWRKQLDTRAGRWLLAVLAVIVLGAQSIMFAVEGGNHSFGDYMSFAAYPVGLFLPIIGILAVTSEWSQRTALVTFTLEPRRTRVSMAKLVSAVLTALCALAFAFALGALVTFAAIGLRGATPDWQIPAPFIVGMLVFMITSVVQGVGFGMVFLNTPAAIVSYFVLPTLWTILGATVAWLADAAKWLDLSMTMDPLLSSGQWLDAGQWARLGTSVAVWILLPLVAGVIRVNRQEVKSS